MTQTSSAIIVTVESSMEYAELCMGMRLDNVRYSAMPGVSTDREAPGSGQVPEAM
jgi:hypothetical protein